MVTGLGCGLRAAAHRGIDRGGKALMHSLSHTFLNMISANELDQGM
jgi:hypothetical protein